MIYIDTNIKTPIYEQIYGSIKNDICNGTLPPGSTLCPIRELASQLCVGKNTVENAYQQLLVEGYISSKVGSGYTVENIQEFTLPVSRNSLKQKKDRNKKNNSNKEVSSVFAQYNFQYGNISVDSFPERIWRKYMMQVLSSNNLEEMTMYGDKKGNLDLRNELKIYLKSARGISCETDQIIITSGLQNALDIICKILPESDRIIGFEEPGYYGARIVFEQNKIPLVPLDIFSDCYTAQTLNDIKVRAVYITPSHQFPTGKVMPIKKRFEVLAWAAESGGYIIEDDYDSELRYHSKPIPSLHSIDENERVIYIGTFSKALSPAIRMNYIVLPPSLLLEYERVFLGFYSTASCLEQKVLAEFMHDGSWEKHLRRICKINRQRHDWIISAIKEFFGDKITISGENAGLHLLIQYPSNQSQEELLRRARDKGVLLYSISDCYIDKSTIPEDVFLLGFARMDMDDIYSGIKKLAEAWER